MERIAKGPDGVGPAVQGQAHAQIAKGNGLGSVQLTVGLTMDSPTIDDTHTRAICDEIGERLRTLLNSSMPGEITDFDDRLREFSDSEVEGERATAH